MKKKTIILIAGIAVAAVASAIFVFRGDKNAYLNSLPGDATALARLDTKAFLDEADLSLQELLQLLRCSQEEGKVETGLDVTRPVYAFTSPSGYMGVAAAVGDEDDLQTFCSSLQTQGRASEITSQRGYSWVVLQQQWLLAFDKKKALLMGPAVGAAQEQLRGEMARLLEQDKKESATESTLYAELKKAEEPLAAVVAPEVLPAQARDLLRSFNVTSLSDALLLLDMEVEKNELKLEAEVLARNEAVRQELKRLDEVLRPIDGELLSYTSEDHVAWMAANVEGETLLSALRSNNNVRTSLIALNLIFDLDRIISSVDGDVALELRGTTRAALASGSEISYEWDDVLSHLQLTAQVKNTDFLAYASSWGNMFVEVQSLSPQDFALNLGTSSLYFGVQEDIFYMGSQKGLTENTNTYLRRERADVKGARFFATCRLPKLTQMQGVQIPLPDALTHFERLNIEMERAGELKLELIAPEGTQIVRDVLFQANELMSRE